jgi:hypothetical protein
VQVVASAQEVKEEQLICFKKDFRNGIEFLEFIYHSN